MNEIAVRIKNLSVIFGEFIALDDLSIDIESGLSVSILGPNGAGKSTLIKTLLGLIRPNLGKIELFGKSGNLIDFKEIGYIPQLKTLDKTFPARAIELVATAINNRWSFFLSKKEKALSMSALEKVGAQDLAYKSIAHLSGGELQRVFFARATMNSPKIALLDEPASGVDAIGEIDLLNLLEDYQKNTNSTVLMVTHDWETAYHHSDKILLLNKKLIAYDTPAIAFEGDNLRKAFGHIGHSHEMKIGANK